MKKQELQIVEKNIYKYLAGEKLDFIISNESEMITEILKLKGNLFDKFLNQLNFEEMKYLYSIKRVKLKITRRLRNNAGNHEWCPVAKFPIFKKWGLTVEDVRSYTTKTKEVFFSIDGRIDQHCKGCSSLAHKQLFDLIDNSNSFEEYLKKLNIWADSHLTNSKKEMTSRKFLPSNMQL